MTATGAAGKLHLLDLAGIKSQMGERWARMAEPLEGFFEGAIRRNLGHGDTYVRRGELSYVLLLRDLSAQEAQVKCRIICEELSERLFGRQIRSASLRSLVAPLPAGFVCGTAIPDTLDDMLERDGAETIVRIGPGSEGAHSVPGYGEEADCITAKFRHRPIWDTSMNVVINYLCQSAGAVEFSGENPAADSLGPEARQALTDRAVLRECALRMQAVHARGFRLVSGVTIALDTVSYSRLWSGYFRELQKIPPGISRDFIFFVTGLDSGIPNIRLAQELPKLSKYARGIFCVLNDRGYVGARFARTGTHAIGIDLPAGGAEALAAARIAELSQQAASASIPAFVLGLSSTSLLLHAMAQGIRYLEGPVVRPAVAEPRFAFAQSLEDIYASA